MIIETTNVNLQDEEQAQVTETTNDVTNELTETTNVQLEHQAEITNNLDNEQTDINKDEQTQDELKQPIIKRPLKKLTIKMNKDKTLEEVDLLKLQEDLQKKAEENQRLIQPEGIQIDTLNNLTIDDTKKLISKWLAFKNQSYAMNDIELITNRIETYAMQCLRGSHGFYMAVKNNELPNFTDIGTRVAGVAMTFFLLPKKTAIALCTHLVIKMHEKWAIENPELAEEQRKNTEKFKARFKDNKNKNKNNYKNNKPQQTQSNNQNNNQQNNQQNNQKNNVQNNVQNKQLQVIEQTSPIPIASQQIVNDNNKNNENPASDAEDKTEDKVEVLENNQQSAQIEKAEKAEKTEIPNAIEVIDKTEQTSPVELE